MAATIMSNPTDPISVAAAAALAVSAQPPPQATTSMQPPSLTRTALTGSWLLLKNRGSPSLRPYLEAMNVDPLAVEAAEKGESEHDTVQHIVLTGTTYSVHKLSRVNDLKLDLTLGVEKVETLPKHPAAGDRVRRSLAASDHPAHVLIQSTLKTVSGTAHVTDVKTLQQEVGPDGMPLTVMVQVLTVRNEETRQHHTTTRYFVPHEGTVEVASTAGGSRRDRGELPERVPSRRRSAGSVERRRSAGSVERMQE